MPRILVTDYTQTGHHHRYYGAVCRTDSVDGVIIPKSFHKLSEGLMQYISERVQYLSTLGERAGKGQYDIVHILDIGNLYVVGTTPASLHCMKLIGTLHQLPSNPIKWLQLKRFASQHTRIVVHSEYLCEQLALRGVHNGVVIEYPSLHNNSTDSCESLRKKFSLPEDKVVITALGATRLDKGANILAMAMGRIGREFTKRIHVVIAGEERDVKRNEIEKYLDLSAVSYTLRLEHLPEVEFEEFIKVSDLIVLPYLKKFNGNSGPMTEAVYREIPVIGPSHGNIGWLITTYGLGYTFRPEDPEELAAAIQKHVSQGWKPSQLSRMYRNRLNLERFVMKHSDLYADVHVTCPQ